MAATNNRKVLTIGLLIASVSSVTAWAIGRNPAAVEPAPMEAMLEEAEKRAAVSWDLPVTRNESVETWIDFLKGRNADKTQLWMERSGKFGPMIQTALRERGMPEDLIYLAFIESGFSPKAYSSAAASGIWQFIAETGKRYGLEVGSYVDERRDPLASTNAALAYLSDLYDRFGSWYLAAAAYNTGENRVGRIMREETGSERGTDADFWRIASRLPRETRNYVPLMLAAGHIGKEPEKYGFEEVRYQEALVFDTVWVPGQVSMAAVARAAGADEQAVMDLNPHLVKGVTPPDRAWPVRIPRGQSVAFAAAFPPIYQAEVAQRAAASRAAASRASASRASASKASSVKRHKVARGETLSHVARRYGVTVRQIQGWNGMGNRTTIRAGQTLKVSA